MGCIDFFFYFLVFSMFVKKLLALKHNMMEYHYSSTLIYFRFITIFRVRKFWDFREDLVWREIRKTITLQWGAVSFIYCILYTLIYWIIVIFFSQFKVTNMFISPVIVSQDTNFYWHFSQCVPRINKIYEILKIKFSSIVHVC